MYLSPIALASIIDTWILGIDSRVARYIGMDNVESSSHLLPENGRNQKNLNFLCCGEVFQVFL